MVAELRERPYEFDIQVQLCADLEQMPVEDVTVEWPEELSPFVTVAKLRFPQQDISGEDNLEKMDALSFTPVAGDGRTCAPRQHHAGTQGGLPPFLDPAPRAEPAAAHRTPQRRRGASVAVDT